MAAITDDELLRKIFNVPANKPLNHFRVSDALSPRPYSRRREIVARLIADGRFGWVHTQSDRIVSFEDQDGLREFTSVAGEVYVSADNGVTTNRRYRASSATGATSYAFLLQPLVGMSLAEVEHDARAFRDQAAEERAAERQRHAESPLGAAERAITAALRADTVSLYEGTKHGDFMLSVGMLNQQQVDHLVMVLRANPYQGDKA
jgi:hypothetical protein